MASQAERDCLSNPNFAVICSFMDRYAETLGLPEIGYKDLQEWVEDSKNMSPLLIDLHVRLMRRIHKKFSSVTADRWERGVVKFCYKYSNVDAWEIERFGYKLAKISTKLTLLKNLMESQFDCNNKFKDKVNEIPIEDMRFQPIGRDKNGMAYWYFLDKELNLRVYREHQDDVDSESWQLVCRSRDELAKLITGLEYGTDIKLDKLESSDQSEPVSDVNEDSGDSFRQKTPLGPSPLTIKQEPGDGDATSGDSKQSIVLKISKSDIQSPSKMLKDKFVKEKGSEIKKIMCKMKKEGLVDSDDDDKVKNKDYKTDEVDGPINSTSFNEDKDSFKCDIMNKDVETEECSEKVSIEKEINEVPSNNDNVDNEGIARIEIEKKVQEIPDSKKNESNSVENKETEVNNCQKESQKGESLQKDVSSTEKDQKIGEKEQSHVSNINVNSETRDLSNPVDVKSPENKVGKETNPSEEKDKNDIDANTVNDTTEDPLCSEQYKILESENKEKIEIPQKESLGRSESCSSSIEETKALKIESHETLSNRTENGEQGSSDTVESPNDPKPKQSEAAAEMSVTESVSLKTLVKINGNVSEIIETSSENKSMESDASESKLGMQLEDKIDSAKENETASSIDDLHESRVIEQSEKKSNKSSEEVVSENPSALENSLEQNVKFKTGEEGKHTSENEQPYESKLSIERLKLEDSEIKSSKADYNVKKARKRKNDEIKSDIVNSSTDDEIDNESVHPSKRTIISAVRKSPNKLTEVETELPEVETELPEVETDLPDDEIKVSSVICDKIEAKKDIQSENHENEEKSVCDAACEEKSDEKEVLLNAAVTDKKELSDEKEVLQNAEETEKKAIEKEAVVGEMEELKEQSDEKIEHKRDSESAEMEEKKELEKDKDATEIEEKKEIVKDTEVSEIEEKKESKRDTTSAEIDENKEIEKDVDTAKIEKKNELDMNTDTVEIGEKKELEKVKESAEMEEQKEIEKGTEVVEMEEKEQEETETSNKSQRKVKGLVAHSRKSKSKAQKRQAENSDDMEPAEPASKKSKLRGRVSSKGRGKRRGVNFDSSSSDDDIPLSQMAGRGRGNNTRGKAGPEVGKQQVKVIMDPPKKKKVEEDQKEEALEIPPDLSEDDAGRRRSARVRSMRARKQKSPSPDYVPSEFEESDDEFVHDDDDAEFTLKLKKRKKKEPKDVVEELPKGRNALRHETKTKKNTSEVIEEEEEAACVKCLRSHQPEWILLCDKCDAGYHTACLRPPLMIIPDGDWFCPPCEHAMLKQKLEENLKTLDQAILKNDRLNRRKERLAFVSVSLDNVLKEPDPEVQKVKTGRRQKKPNYRESGEESESGVSSESGSSESTSESESSSGGERTHGRKAVKPKYIQRTCRTKKSVSYRFEEFDELIMDAIEEDLSIPKEPKPKKTKPPGINRGKDMSNILGVSDEEMPKKPVRKRRPRLTELDEDIDDDDTDDYQLSDASEVSDATKSYESEEVSEDSIESAWRSNIWSSRKSRRKGGRNRKYRDDFVVDSDFESEDDPSRRSKRRTQRGKVNYKEINSDETEVEDNDDSFHSSELSDSDFESKRKKRIERKKKQTIKERPRSGKRQRIRRVSSSSESSETDSDDSTPRKKIGKKPPSKTARYDSDETDQSVEKSKAKKSKKKNVKGLSDASESEAEGTEVSETSETEVSEPEEKKTKPKQKKKNVIKSESEDEDKDEDKTDIEKETDNESHDSEETEGSGWEEIGVESEGENVTNAEDNKIKQGLTTKHKQKAKTTDASEMSNEEGNITRKKKLEDTESEEKTEIAAVKTTENIETDNKADDKPKLQPDAAETMRETFNIESYKEDVSATDLTPTKKKRGRKSDAEKGDNNVKIREDVTPKKRGRKPKAKPEPSEVNVDEIPIKKKRGRNVKSDTANEFEPAKDELLGVKVETDDSVIVENKKTVISEMKDEESEKPEESQKLEEQTSNDNSEAEGLQAVEKNKDDSPLSARNKQNAPVGVVKPEVRQGVIVENKHVIDSRLNENRAGETVNPLQGMRDLAMGNQNIPGSHQSSFTPYSQSHFGSQNMPGYMGQPGFQGYPHQVAQYGPGGPGGQGPNHPYPGPPGMPPGAPSQFPPSQGPMSPNSFQQHSSFIGQMQQGPPGFYPGNYRPPMGHPEGFGPPNAHGSQSPSFQPGQNPQYYRPHQTPYQGHGYSEHPGHYMGPQGHMSHPPSGPGPYPGMPYNYPNMPPQRPVYGPAGPQSMSPNQPIRPQTRLAGPTPAQQGSSPNPRTDNEQPNRGFMMDNILKPTAEGPSNDVEDSAEVSDIDRYTSFLCKSE